MARSPAIAVPVKATGRDCFRAIRTAESVNCQTQRTVILFAPVALETSKQPLSIAIGVNARGC
jgi:hypothetical protein